MIIKNEIQNSSVHNESIVWNSIVQLLLGINQVKNLGLMNGKMGISIILYNLFKKTNNLIYEETADELIEDIYNELNESIPINFENGLAGIGYGIEILVQDGFIDAVTNEILADIDERISKEIKYNVPHEIGLLRGIIGIGTYFATRLRGSRFQKQEPPTVVYDSIIYIIEMLNNRLTNDEIRLIFENSIDGNVWGRFDVLSDYSMLLLFIADLIDQSISQEMVRGIADRVLDFICNDFYLPKMHSERLLLAFMLKKVSNAIDKNLFFADYDQKQLLNYEDVLFMDIQRESIELELSKRNTLRYGRVGIAFLYKMLYEGELEEKYKNEFDYWLSGYDALDISVRDNLNIKNNYSEYVFGLLEGYAGIILTTL